MCEDTVFWDLNYAIKYKSLGTEEIRSKVLVLMERLDERLFEHPNFVWLGTIHILRKHLYSTKLNLTSKIFTKTGFYCQNK